MPEDESDLNDTIQFILGIITRRRWWIIVTACGVTLATILVLCVLPNRYTSEATLLVVQQQVPQRYVVPNSTTDIAAALQAMKQEVLSRTRLLTIINEADLYPKERISRAPEEVVALMLHDIDIQPLEEGPQQHRDKDFNAFRISFTAENPYLAQRVANTLTSLFIEENLKSRGEQATNTTKFLHGQLDAAEKKLAQQEQRLRDFKMQYLGELPEQQQGNLSVLSSLQTQLQNTMASKSRAQEQRVYLESLLSGYQALSTRNVPLPTATALAPASSDVKRNVSPTETAQTSLARLRSEREVLLSQYTPRHPDVMKIEREISAAEAVLEHLKANAPLIEIPDGAGADKTAAPKPANPERPLPASPSGTIEPAVAQIKSQLEANRLEMVNLSKDEAQLKTALQRYQDRLNVTPVREQQLTGILRDYDLQKKDYADLLSKVQQSQLATNLERNQGGQQFRLIDPPSLPAIPSSPKRLKINLGGAAAGIVLGFALAFLADLKARSFYTEKQISQLFSPLLVVSVPLLLTPTEKRVRAWKGASEWLAGCALALTVLVAEFYVYRRG